MLRSMLLGLLSGLALVVQAQSPAIVGEAFTLDVGELAYREYHYIDESGLDHRVVYRGPGDDKLAVKTIDYRPGLVTPAFRQENRVDGSLLAVQWQDDALLIQHREKASAAVAEQRVEPPGSLVIDAGFDHFMRRHWDGLVAGETRDFAFPAPTRQSLVTLRASRSDCQSSGDRVSREAITCFAIEPASWFARLLVDPIRLTYATDNRRLLAYQGLSNVKGGREENFRVTIVYQYRDGGAREDAAGAGGRG